MTTDAKIRYLTVEAPPAASRQCLIDIDKGDLNDIVCAPFTVTGSRLARQRVCRTRAEWVNLQVQTRGGVEKVQYYKPTFPTGHDANARNKRVTGRLR